MITYSPNPNTYGSDSFTYTITDGTGAIQAIMYVTVTPVNDSPIATADYDTVLENQVFSIAPAMDVLANDSDVEDGILKRKSYPCLIYFNGAVFLRLDGSFVYTPNPPLLAIPSPTKCRIPAALKAPMQR